MTDAMADVSGTIGWLYFNPDTGMEWASDHPVDSGHCPDAENVHAASAEALLAQLKMAWLELEDARAINEGGS
jgi:hypothetical protein